MRPVSGSRPVDISIAAAALVIVGRITAVQAGGERSLAQVFA